MQAAEAAGGSENDVRMASGESLPSQISNYRFLFSGRASELQSELLPKIESLGGTVVNGSQNSTHIIAKDVTPTEKFMSGLAAGKWCVTIRYVLDSYKERQWLKEEDYELASNNELCKYHRCRIKRMGIKLYEGWKVLVLIDNAKFCKSVRRILAAGGAEIASQSNASDVDFVVTEEKMLDSAKAAVDCFVPLLDASYIKYTMFFREDPSNIRGFNLRNKNMEGSSKKSELSSSGSSSTTSESKIKPATKEPASRTPSRGRKKIPHDHMTQTSMMQFVTQIDKKPSSHRVFGRKYITPSRTMASTSDAGLRKLPVVYDVIDVEDDDDDQNQDGDGMEAVSNPAKRSREIPIVEVEDDGNQGVMEAVSNLAKRLREIPIVEVEDDDNQDVMEAVSNPAKRLREIPIVEVEDDDNQDVIEVGRKSGNRLRQAPAVDDNQNQDGTGTCGCSIIQPLEHMKFLDSSSSDTLIKKYPVKIAQISNKTLKNNMDTIDLTRRSNLGDSDSAVRKASVVYIENHDRIPAASETSASCKIQQQYGNRVSIISNIIQQSTCENKLTCENRTPMKVLPVRESDNTNTTQHYGVGRKPCPWIKPNGLCIAPKSKSSNYLALLQLKDFHICLGERDEALIDCKTRDPPKQKSQKHGSVFKEEQTDIFTNCNVTKKQARNVLLHFLRRRNHLSEICSKSDLHIPRVTYGPSEELTVNSDQQDSLNYPNYGHLIHKREMKSRELDFFISCTDGESKDDKEILVHAIDTLMLQLSSYLYPPPDILGNIFISLIVKTPFCVVHSRALTLAYMLISLHPPNTAKMRDYYLSAMQHAIKRDYHGRYIAWKFVERMIEYAASEEGDQPSSGQDIEEITDYSKALQFLEFVVFLLIEDIRHATYGEPVENLLTWKIFYGSSKNCSILPLSVRKLIQLWMSPKFSSPALRRHLSQLVSILLEVLWRASDEPLVPVDVLPASLGAVQEGFRKSLRGCNIEECIELVWSLPTPWAQGVVSLIFIKEIFQYPNVNSLSSLVSHLKQKRMDSKTGSPPGTDVSESEISTSSWSRWRLPSPMKKNYFTAKSNEHNGKGKNALLSACIKNNVDKVKSLLGKPGVNINLADNEGRTPLHELASRGHLECMKLLLSWSSLEERSPYSSPVRGQSRQAIDLNPKSCEERETPLHAAVIGNNYGVVKLLLQYGGSKLLKDKTADGKTVFDFTTNQKILELLQKYKKKELTNVKSSTSLQNVTEEKESGNMDLLFTLINCHMEMCGHRFLTLQSKKQFERIMCSMEAKQEEKANTPPSSNHSKSGDDDRGKPTKLNHDEESKNSETYMKLNLNFDNYDTLEHITELEKSAISKMFVCLKDVKSISKVFKYSNDLYGSNKDAIMYFKSLYVM